MSRRASVALIALSVVFATLALPRTVQAADRAAVEALKTTGAHTVPRRDGGTQVEFRSAAAITEDVWKQLEAIGDLTSFSVSGKAFDDTQLARLVRLKTLETFFINDVAVTDRGLAALARLPKLQHFGMHHGSVSGAGLAALKDCPQFTSVELGGCLFRDQRMAAAGTLTQLRELILQHDRETSAGLSHLAKLERLERLVLNPNYYPYFTGADLVHVGKLPKLQELTLVEMVIPYVDGLDHLRALRTLKRLRLERCGVTEAELAQLKRDLPETQIEFTSAPEEKVKAWNEEMARRGGAVKR